MLDQEGSSAWLCLRSSHTLHPIAHPCMTTLKTNLIYFSGQLFDQMGSLCWQCTVKLLVEGFALGWEGDIALAILLTNVLQWSTQHDLGDQLAQGCLLVAPWVSYVQEKVCRAVRNIFWTFPSTTSELSELKTLKGKKKLPFYSLLSRWKWFMKWSFLPTQCTEQIQTVLWNNYSTMLFSVIFSSDLAKKAH